MSNFTFPLLLPCPLLSRIGHDMIDTHSPSTEPTKDRKWQSLNKLNQYCLVGILCFKMNWLQLYVFLLPIMSKFDFLIIRLNLVPNIYLLTLNLKKVIYYS